MLAKLRQYEEHICSDISKFAKVLEPHFPHDLIRDGEVLRRMVHIGNDSQRSHFDTDEQKTVPLGSFN